MAKVTRSRHRSRARKPAPNAAPSQRQADASSDMAQRDLLAGILDAASENGGLEKYLSQVVAHLGQYSKCSCVGVLLFNEDDNTAAHRPMAAPLNSSVPQEAPSPDQRHASAMPL